MKIKWKIILSIIGVIVSLALLVASAILVERGNINSTTAIILIVISVILVWLAIFNAAKTDYETGVYKCRKCGHTFKPEFKAYLWSTHTLKTRQLKCPECGKKSRCIRKSKS